MNWGTDHRQVVPGYLLQGMGDGGWVSLASSFGDGKLGYKSWLVAGSSCLPVHLFREMGDWRPWTWSRHLEDGIWNWDTNHGSRQFLLACFKGWKTGVVGCDLVVSRMGWGIGIQTW